MSGVLKVEPIDIPIKLHSGEVAVLSLAKKLGIKDVLVDEKPARFAAKLLNLKPRGTLFVLLKALKEEIINFDEFIDTLNEMVGQGFRLREEVVIEAIKEAKKIINRKKNQRIR